MNDLLIALVLWGIIAWWFRQQLPLALQQWHHDPGKRWTLPFLGVFLLALLLLLGPATIFQEFAELKRHPQAKVLFSVGGAMIVGCWLFLLWRWRAATKNDSPSA